MLLGIVNIISQIIIVTFVLVGVAIVLLAIRCGTDFRFCKGVNGDIKGLNRDMEDKRMGISEHNLFYRFFFRDKD